MSCKVYKRSHTKNICCHVGIQWKFHCRENPTWILYTKAKQKKNVIELIHLVFCFSMAFPFLDCFISFPRGYTRIQTSGFVIQYFNWVQEWRNDSAWIRTIKKDKEIWETTSKCCILNVILWELPKNRWDISRLNFVVIFLLL